MLVCSILEVTGTPCLGILSAKPPTSDYSLVSVPSQARQTQASESSQEALPFLRAESVEPLKFKTCAAQQTRLKETFHCESALA